MRLVFYLVCYAIFGFFVCESDSTVARYLMPILGSRVPKWLHGETAMLATIPTPISTTTTTTEVITTITEAITTTTEAISITTEAISTTTNATTATTEATTTTTEAISTTTDATTTTTEATTTTTEAISTTTDATTTTTEATTTTTEATTSTTEATTPTTSLMTITQPTTTLTTTVSSITMTTPEPTTITPPTTLTTTASTTTTTEQQTTTRPLRLRPPPLPIRYKPEEEDSQYDLTPPTATPPTTPPPPRGPVTETPMGTVRGLWMRTRRGRRFQAYRGIRYALPPVGELRFQPPKVVQAYAGEVDARGEGPACPAPTKPRPHIRRDEDCLCINVYTPDNNSSRHLPVLVYIHGGGFYSLSGRSDQVGPYYLLDRNIVLVTFNYRLGTLGFLSTGDELAPGNNGFKDQVAALRWVQRNIASFGGDPGSVTLAGCSAGGISVMLHMVSPMSKNLFHRAVSMSGSPVGKTPLPHELLELVVRQAQLVNCTTDSTRDMVECLRRVPWTSFESSIRGFFKFGYDPIALWKPVVEPYFGQERFLTEQPTDLVQEGRLHPVPCIIGQTSDELYWKAYAILRNSTLMKVLDEKWELVAPIALMVPDREPEKMRRLRRAYLLERGLARDAACADALGKLYADAISAFPVHRMATMLSRYSPQPVWYYEFAYTGQRSYYREPDGSKAKRDSNNTIASASLGADRPHASQQDDLIYLFTNIGFPPIELSSRDSDLVDKMTAIFYNFARFGDPNPRGDTPELTGVQWPPMRPDHRHYLRIDRQISVDRNLKEHRFQIWEELYPINYQNSKHYVILEDKTEATISSDKPFQTAKPFKRRIIRKLVNKKTMKEVKLVKP